MALEAVPLPMVTGGELKQRVCARMEPLRGSIRAQAAVELG